MSNIERGERRMSPPDVREADKKLQAGGRLVRLYRELYEGPAPDWLDKLAELQAESELIRESHPSLIPGLLQTRGYARAVISAGGPWLTEGDVEALVDARLNRAERILKGEVPHYHVVMDDTAVTRPVGSHETMREQVAALVELAESGRVLLQVHAYGTWPHHGLDGPFSLLSSATAPDVVHVESVYRGQTTDDPQTVRRFALLYGRLQANAWSPAETAGYLRRVLEEYER